MLPNFLGIGTQRAATTWLFNCLEEHPDVFVPKCKEIYFFNHYYEKGIAFYSTFFDAARSYKAIGEITPGYIQCEACPERIYKHLPNVKMIIILRNPIDRAFSAYKKFVFPKTGLSFEEAICQKPDLLTRGLYSSQLERYFSYFKREQFLILLYEELNSDNLVAIKKVYKFLEINDEYSPSWIGKTSNVSSLSRLNMIINKYKLNSLAHFIMKTEVGNIVRKLHKKGGKEYKAVIDIETSKKLVEYFFEPNQRLAKLLDIDLSLWRTHDR